MSVTSLLDDVCSPSSLVHRAASYPTVGSDWVNAAGHFGQKGGICCPGAGSPESPKNRLCPHAVNFEEKATVSLFPREKPEALQALGRPFHCLKGITP